LNINLISVVLI